MSVQKHLNQTLMRIPRRAENSDRQIDLSHIRRAARDWYLRDKLTAVNANESARGVLRKPRR